MALNLNKTISSMLPRMAAESFVIVASILLALSADTCLDARRQDDQRADYLLSLARDFEQMSVRANDPFRTADKAVKSGKKLLDHLINSPIVERGPAEQWLDDLAYYEVFSPSVGAYEALVASGNIELLSDNPLVHELAEFFGSFSDLRASERLLLDSQLHFAESETYAQLAGDHRLGTLDFPSAGKAPVDQWKNSDSFMNAIAHITYRQMDVLDDYSFLVGRIARIRDVLPDKH